ncbi:MAG: hypothetical protein LKG52_04560 [Lactobacillus sp.]|nr:hypothetical protein [Lactobacillus sp.]MCI1883555.1 hypothetical protein [Lactobacillus sp.]
MDRIYQRVSLLVINCLILLLKFNLLQLKIRHTIQNKAIIYVNNGGNNEAVKTVSDAIKGSFTDGKATEKATDINKLIDDNLPQGYHYVSGKLTEDKAITPETASDITVVVAKDDTTSDKTLTEDQKEAKEYTQVIKFYDESTKQTLAKSEEYTGSLENGSTTEKASDVNAFIDQNIPNGYEYVSGKLDKDRTININDIADITVTVKKAADTTSSKSDEPGGMSLKFEDAKTKTQLSVDSLDGTVGQTIPLTKSQEYNKLVKQGYHLASGDSSVVLGQLTGTWQLPPEHIVYMTKD